MSRKLLLGGASALAILVAASAADAATFITPGEASFTASVTGEYSFEALGASGGNFQQTLGGLGAGVSGDLFLTAGEQLTLFVGGRGGDAFVPGFGYAGGGGGGSFIFLGTGTSAANLLAAAGGGGGAGISSGGGSGLAGQNGGNSRGAGGYVGVGGVGGGGGGGGNYARYSGGGAGVKSAGSDGAQAGYGASGYGGHTFPTPTGGNGQDAGASGGFGGGGGAAASAPAGAATRAAVGAPFTAVAATAANVPSSAMAAEAAVLLFPPWSAMERRPPAKFGRRLYRHCAADSRGPRTFDLGDDARRLCRPRLARADAQAQDLAGLTRRLLRVNADRCSRPPKPTRRPSPTLTSRPRLA